MGQFQTDFNGCGLQRIRQSRNSDLDFLSGEPYNSITVQTFPYGTKNSIIIAFMKATSHHIVSGHELIIIIIIVIIIIT